jgi:hypothetical protein
MSNLKKDAHFQAGVFLADTISKKRGLSAEITETRA